MKRGDVWLVDLGPRAGKRPAVILTRDAVIPYLNKLTVAEITSKGKGYPTEIDIGLKANLKKRSFVHVDNIQTVSKERFIKAIGSLEEKIMNVISRKVIFALNLE
ncbi:type II toxin-antitoxin system PemK/MazF family toxin [candidate division KSB1 bacterium]|nr:type II toxin-antitoxin system PemK/MazF family toxin [candidate division KSB1 bacterium]